MKKTYKFKKICHTKCYKFDTLWQLGDIYEGDEDPGKHFSEDGTPDSIEPPRISPDDPRSTDELIDTLKQKFRVTVSKSRGRKFIWNKLNDMEQKAARDAQTQDLAPEPEVKVTTAKKRVAKKKE